MCLDLEQAEREVYHILDWIGDLGGLYDGLKIFLSGILYFITYKMYDSYMVAHLFSVRANHTEDNQKNKVKAAL